MKKNILLLLVSSLLSLGTAQGAHNHEPSYPATATIDITHPAEKACPGEKKDLKTTNTGNHYDWYKFNESTNKYEYSTSTGGQTNAARPVGKYLCAITKENSGGNVNLLTGGNFNFECHDTQHRNINGDNYFGHTKDGITYLMRELNCYANDGTYPGGFTCIKDNANNVKPRWFEEVTNRTDDGSNMLVCDGMNSSDFRVWIAENVPVQAGVTYEFSCKIANVDNQYNDADTNGDHGPNSLPRLRFWVEQNGNRTQLSQFDAPRVTGEFRPETATFKPTSTGKCTIYIQNYTTFDEGNDFAIDDIYFGEPQNSTTTKLESFEIVEDNCTTTATETKSYTPCIGTTCTLSPVTTSGTATWKDNNGNPVTNLTINIVDGSELTYECTVETTGSNGYPLTITETHTITPKDCSKESEDSQTYTPCVGKTCSLSPKNAGSPTWQTLSGDPVEDLEISIENLDPITYICIVETTDENGYPLTITETHTITPKDCDEEHISKICNFKGDSTLVATFVGNDYVWNGPNVVTSETEPNKLTINVVKGQVGSVLEYTCDVYFVDTNSDISHPTGRPPVYVGTDIFKITIVDCTDHTSDEQTKQVEKGGSITISVPNEHKCNGCEYHWYKIVDGEEVEITKNPQYSIPEHTIENAQESVYVCKIYNNGNTHTITYNIQVLDTISVCYDPSSEDEQTKTIEGIKGDSDNHTWLWEKDGTTIPFPADYAKTENNIITLDLSKFATGSLPTNVKIIHEYENLETTPEPEDPEEEEEEDIIGANKMKINVDLENVLSMSQFDGNKTITVDEHTQFIISDNYEYAQKFDTKNDEMEEHKGVLRVTDKGLGETIAADPAGDKVNDYFIDIDGGSKEGAMFTIKSTGKFVAGEKYLFTFLFVNTNSNTTKNQPELECVLKTNTGETIVLAERFKIDKDYWHTWNKLFTIEEDAESVEITFSNYTTSPGQNDFAIDNIELTADIPDYLKRAETRAIALKTWKEEITLIIKPYTKQDVTETSHPDKEYELDVKLTYNDKNEYVTFFYDPNVSYVEGMKQYVDYKEATNLYGCPHLVSFTLKLFSIKPDIFFTPNEDGINDKWMVEGIEDVPNAHIMIYDRYSKLLYKGTGADFQGWDGNYNGHGMVQDDYWYVIQIPETDETLSGHFVLKR